MEQCLAMKKIALAILLLLFTSPAWGQCNGTFNPGQVCGNSTASPAPAGPAILTAVLNKGPIIVAVRSASTATVNVSATTDYFLCLDPTSNAITVNLPPLPVTGLTFLVKDCTGQALIHNITIAPATGTIDGAGGFTININFQSIAVTYTGTQWSIN